MERRVSRSVAVPVLVGALLLVVILSAGQGPVAIAYPAVAAILADAAVSAVWDGLVGGSPPISLFGGPSDHALIVRDIRAPRIAVAATVGFALAAAGTVMQGFFRNPMADPAIVGVSSGAALGAVAVIVSSVAVPFGVPAAAFAGALIAAFTVYAIATTNGRTGVARLLLAGVAMQTFLGAMTSLALYLGDDAALRTAVFWMMGDLGGKSWSEVGLVAGPTVAGFAVLMYYTPELDMLLLGEAEANGLGVAVERTKRILLAVSSLVTAVAVAVAGVIGFVGLIVPHAVRLVVGPDHRVLLPASAIAGAVFLVGTDALARTVLGGAQLPIGIVTALVGVPFFLHLLRRREVYEL